MQVDYLDHLPDPFITDAFDLYLDAFEDKLNPILGNSGRSRDVFLKNLDATRCLAAVGGQRLVGILALQDNNGSFMNPTLKTMIKSYGIPGGVFRMFGLIWLNHPTAPGELYVDGVAVVDDMRGNGIGSHLLKMLERIASRKGIRTISLEVINTNLRAETLYRRLGFEVAKQRTVKPLNWFFNFPFQSFSLMVKRIN